MTKADSKGRIVLPKDVRERLGITPGTEVEIYEEDGKAVVEPEDDPQQIIDRMETLVAEAASKRGETTPLDEEADCQYTQYSLLHIIVHANQRGSI